MKRSFITFLKYSLVSAAFVIITVNTNADYLPKNWYILPEENDFYSIDKNFDDNKLETPGHLLKTNVSNLLTSNNHMFSYIKSTPSSKYKLTNIRTSFGIGLKGIIGLSVAKGTSTLNFTWRRKKKSNQSLKSTKSAFNRSNSFNDHDKTFYFTNDIDPNSLKLQLTPAFGLIEGRFSNKSKISRIKKIILDKVSTLYYLAHAIDGSPNSGDWYAEVIRMDLGISASGSVSSFANFEGGLNFRFEFAPIKKKRLHEINNNRESTTSISAPKLKMNKINNSYHIISTLITDLNLIGQDYIKNKKYQFSTMRIGLASSASGNIGIAKLGGKILGILHLRKRGTKAGGPTNNKSTKNLNNGYLYFMNDNLKVRKFSNKHHISYQTEAIEKSNKNHSIFIYKITRSKLRRGIRRGLRMASYFLNIIDKKPFRNWEVWKVENDFTLSITGSLGMASLTETAVLRLGFELKKNGI